MNGWRWNRHSIPMIRFCPFMCKLVGWPVDKIWSWIVVIRSMKSLINKWNSQFISLRLFFNEGRYASECGLHFNLNESNYSHKMFSTGIDFINLQLNSEWWKKITTRNQWRRKKKHKQIKVLYPHRALNGVNEDT